MSEILLKRGLKANLPVLAIGEPAWTTDTNELYIGSPGGNRLISNPGGVGLASYPITGAFATDTSTFNLKTALPTYLVGTDAVFVYIGGVLQTLNDNYAIDETGVLTKLNDGTGLYWPAGYTYDIIIMKNVVDTELSMGYINGGTF